MSDLTPESNTDDPYSHEEAFDEVPDEVTQLIRISEEKNKLHADLAAGVIAPNDFDIRMRSLIASEQAIFKLPPSAA